VSSAAPRTAVVFDPHPLWIDAVTVVLRGIGFEVVGGATETNEALELIARERPSLLVAEITTEPGQLSSLELIPEAKDRVEGLRVLVLSSAAEPAQIEAALERGANAYVLKTAQHGDLASAVRQAFEHSVFFASARSGPGPSAAPGAEADVLTRRELEILRLAAEGRTNAQMAKLLWVTEQTVKFHLSNVYRKLKVENRTEASHWAQRHGVLMDESEPAVGE
jgi:DNA-binding NarL/FixJ family response regulator